MIKQIHEIIVYENEDKTRSIYTIDTGSTELSNFTKRYMKMIHICELAENNTELNKLLEQVEIYYELVRTKND
jgi:hypothetical protein